MNPFLSILLFALAAVGVILLVAVVLSVIVVASGEKYAAKQRAELEQKLSALAGDDLLLAQKLLDGEVTPEECDQIPEDNRFQIELLLQDWQAEKERVRQAAEENRKKRNRRKGWLRFGPVEK